MNEFILLISLSKNKNATIDRKDKYVKNINISLNLMLFRILTSLFNPSLKTCLFGRSNIAREKTRQMLAIFDPITLPIAIIDCPSKLDKIEIKISGDDVPNPIIKKLERNPDI